MKNNEFKLLWKYIKPCKIRIVFYTFLTIIKYFGLVISPLFLGFAIEAITRSDWNDFFVFAISFSVSKLFTYTLLDYICVYLYNYIEIIFIKNVTKDMYEKVNNLPAIAFEEKGTGEISNRLTSDPDKVIGLLSSLIRLISNFISFIFLFFFILAMSYIIAIEMLLFIGVMSIVIYIIFPRLQKLVKDNRDSSDKLNKAITENITGIREIKSLGIKRIINRRVNKNVDDLTSKVYKVNKYLNIYWHLNNSIYYLFELIIYLTAGYLVFKGEFSIALFISLQGYLYRIDSLVYSFGDFTTNFTKVKVSLNRIDEIISNKLYKDVKYGDKVLENNSGVIEFKDVSFKYDNDNNYTLDNLNIKFESNKKNAIIGRSGNGKSTIFNLLVRFFDVSNGEILIDGVNILELDEDSLRKNISIIRQNPYIFNMSIKDNLKLVKPDCTDEEIIEVCKRAYIHDYINSLENKYDTMIGEGGVNLSGGQKQRLAIARTLLVESKVILFDEATSALDNESQEYIKKTIDDLIVDHTVIIIAHRLSTIMDADIINVIDNGNLVDKGNHTELMKNSDIYKNLYNSEI